MINKILNKEVNGVKISVVQFKDYLWLGEPSFEVAIVDADDVKVIGNYYTEEEALKVAEELIAQATEETETVEAIGTTLEADEFAKIIEAYDFSIDEAVKFQRVLTESMVGAFSKTIKEFIWKRFDFNMDNADYPDLTTSELLYNNIGEFLELTMYRVNIYNTEFNKFFTYWMPKAII